jgi:hypothetical protein
VESSAKPIVSTRAEDPDFDERIDRFVVSLGERVDALQDAESAGDRAKLQALAAALREEASELGYPPLADAAARVDLACGEQGMETLRKSVFDLTEVSQRVRRGHRSAAG